MDPLPSPGPTAEEAWQAAVARVLQGADFDEVLVGRTLDGIPVGPLYAEAGGPAASPWRDPERPFLNAPRIDRPDLDGANDQALIDVENGANGLTLVLATAPAARGFGTEAGTAEDFGRLLSGIPLEGVTVRLEPGSLGARPIPLALAAAIATRRQDPAGLDIDFGLDPVGDMARCGAAPEPWPALARSTCGVVASLRDDGFRGPMLRADGRPHHEAGASEAEELAAVLATALAYLRALEHHGTEMEAARDALSFVLVADAEAFLGIAKLRALRRLWARVEEIGGLEPKPIRLHAETAWRMMTRRDPWTNAVRTTLACGTALLGGADGVTVLPHTATLGLPDESARRLARNTPLILIEEARLLEVADPAAGSGAFESLTGALCDKAWGFVQDLEKQGGLVAALETGWWQARIADTRARRHARLAAGETSIVGTTAFVAEHGTEHGVLPVTPRHAPALHFGPSGLRFEPLRSERDAEPFERQGGER